MTYPWNTSKLASLSFPRESVERCCELEEITEINRTSSQEWRYPSPSLLSCDGKLQLQNKGTQNIHR